MKRQYFGDRSDYFKFSICYRVFKKCNCEKFIWVAMLTPDDIYKEESWVEEDVIRCFNAIKDITCIRRLFGDKTVIIDQEFKAGNEDNRKKYFDSIFNVLDENDSAFILIDPDTGIVFSPDENKKNYIESEKHIRMKEIECIAKRLSKKLNRQSSGNDSNIGKSLNKNFVIAVFQYRHRGKKLEAHVDEIYKQVKIHNWYHFVIGKGDAIMLMLFNKKCLKNKVLKVYEDSKDRDKQFTYYLKLT